MAFNKARTKELLKKELNKDVLEEIIALNMGLVYSQLKSFNLLNDPDALSLALDGLYKAIISYKSDTAEFSTYATVCIRNGILQAIRSNKDFARVCSLQALFDSIGDAAYQNRALVDEGIVINNEDLIYRSINEIVSEASPSVARVLTCWIESDFTLLNKEIAEKLAVSQPYVNRVINTFRAKLAKKLKEENY